MTGEILFRAGAAPLGLEDRPEAAVNGAPAGSGVATEAQALILDVAASRGVLVSADLIWFACEQAERLRGEIAAELGCAPEAVVLAATHTHGTPNPDAGFAYGGSSAELVRAIDESVRQAVRRAAQSSARPAKLLRGIARAPGLAVHRRRLAWTRIGARPTRRVQNLPNPARRIDDRVTFLALVDPVTAAPLATIAHFACHPVADPPSRRGADYPGLLREALRRRHGADMPCLFLQGFCGDIRPALRHTPSGAKDWAREIVVGARFRASRPGDAEALAAGLERACAQALESAAPIDVMALRCRRQRLPIGDSAGAPSGRLLDVTQWDLAPSLRLLFAGAEMLSGLAPADPHTVAVGYANGMIGYLAPAADHAGGGYEIDGFLPRFGLRRRFDPGFEAQWRAAIAPA